MTGQVDDDLRTGMAFLLRGAESHLSASRPCLQDRPVPDTRAVTRSQFSPPNDLPRTGPSSDEKDRRK